VASLTSLLVASALAANAGGQPPAAPDDRSYASVVSIDRVKAALERPPSRLTLVERKPDFTVDIRERERFERLVAPILDFVVGPGMPQSALFASPFGSQPLFKVELMPMVMAGVSAVNAARKAYAKHAAIADVGRTIAAYCAAQPDRSAGIEICEK
jgi:hypothetical protein